MGALIPEFTGGVMLFAVDADVAGFDSAGGPVMTGIIDPFSTACPG
ncbi:MAG: hypothetical protein ACR2IE_16625 [Candidatus Sumerlaeaceae bacterium]